MLSHLKYRPAGNPVLILGADAHQVDEGDWVYLELIAGGTLGVEVLRTDQEAPNQVYEGRVQSIETDAAAPLAPLAHPDLQEGQRIQFEEGQIFSCLPQHSREAHKKLRKHHHREQMRIVL